MKFSIFLITLITLTACGKGNVQEAQNGRDFTETEFLYQRINDCEHQQYTKHYLVIENATIEDLKDFSLSKGDVEFYFRDEEGKKEVSVVIKTYNYGAVWSEAKKFKWSYTDGKLNIEDFETPVRIGNQFIAAINLSQAKVVDEFLAMNPNEYQLSCVSKSFIQN